MSRAYRALGFSFSHITQAQISVPLDAAANLRLVSRVQELQKSQSDPPYGLLSLVHEFRHFEASSSRDNLYTLRCLIKTDQYRLQITVDYRKREDDMWKDFTKLCIERHRNLPVLDPLDGLTGWDLPQSSWAPSWGRPFWAKERIHVRC
jgi:hypothetical protein